MHLCTYTPIHLYTYALPSPFRGGTEDSVMAKFSPEGTPASKGATRVILLAGVEGVDMLDMLAGCCDGCDLKLDMVAGGDLKSCRA
jgi:hypothetical protein